MEYTKLSPARIAIVLFTLTLATMTSAASISCLQLLSGSDKEKYLIALLRGEDERIQTLKSEDSPNLFSERVFERGPVAWRPVRRMELVSLGIKSYRNLRIERQAPEFELLPDSLRQIFNEGKVLVTSSRNSSQREYQALMATSPSPFGSEGRTGILLQNGQPMIVQVKGKDFLVEVKGLGTPDGGFDYHYKSQRGSIRGGIEAASARFEIAMSALDNQKNPLYTKGDAVIAVGVITFDSIYGKQGYLVRLTPSSVRSTFRKNPALPQMDSPAMTEQLAQKFGERWGSLIGRGLIPFSHYENLVALSGLKDFAVVDHQDIAPIGIFPFDGVAPEPAARFSLSIVSEVPGYKTDSHFELFRAGLLKGLQEGDLILPQVLGEVKNAKNIEEIGAILWEKFLVLVCFRQRGEHGWLPGWFAQKDFFAEPNALNFESVEKLKLRHAKNLNEISDIQRRLTAAKKNFTKAEAEYEKLKSKGYARRAWKARRAEQNKFWNDEEIEAQLQTRLLLLENNLALYPEWVSYQSNAITTLQSRNRGIEETGFTLKGLIALMQSRRYLAAINSGHFTNSRYSDIPTGGGFAQLLILRKHLADEIKWLQKAKALANSSEKLEVEKNILLAQARLDYLQTLNAQEYNLIRLKDPDYVLLQALLPYHIKQFSPDLLGLTKFSKEQITAIERLKAAGIGF